MLKEAFQYLAGLGVQSAAAKDKVNVMNGAGRDFLVKADGTAEMLVERKNYSSTVTGILGFIEAVKMLCDKHSGVVQVIVYTDAIRAIAPSDELNQPAMVQCQLTRSMPFEFLSGSADFNRDPAWHSPTDMIRILRVSPLYKCIEKLNLTLQSLDSMSWATNQETTGTTPVRSRSSYGMSTANQVKVSEGAQELTDIAVNVRCFEDVAVPTRDNVGCYWEFDHVNKRVALVPFGGELERVERMGFDALQGLLTEQLGHISSEKLRLIFGSL